MTVYAQPGSSFLASVSKATTGQVGTIGVRISNLATQTDFLARTVAGITEYPANSGIYARTFTAPTIAGTYSIIWDLAGVDVDEDLIVTASSPGGSAPSGNDLTTLAAVKAQLKKTDANDDAILQTLITAASGAIGDYCQREFTQVTATRRFDVDVDTQRVSLAPYDLLSPTSVTLYPESTTPRVLTRFTDYDLLPVGQTTLGTYTSVSLSGFLVVIGQQLFRFGFSNLDIAGVWGAAAIPAIVAKACDITAAEWFRSKVTAFSTTFTDDGVHVAPSVLPAVVCGLLMPYERKGYAL